MLKIILAIVLFSVIVIFHELGHFLFAKKNGICVEEFAIGIGPTIFGKQIGETKYSIKCLPFGGCCVMLGEDDDCKDPRAFGSQSALARFSVIFAGPFFNFILAFVLALFVIGFSGADPAVAGEISADSGAYEAGLREGDRIVKLDGSRIYNFREISLFNYLHKDKADVEVTYERDGKQKTVTVTRKKTEAGTYAFGISMTEDTKEGIIGTLKYSILEVRYQIKSTFLSLKYLITGLGNIGSEYWGTRHNIGFRVVNHLVESVGGNFTEERYGAIARIRVKNCDLIVLKPNTFMNLSGNAVRYWLQKENIPVENLLIVVDDLALPFGTLRLKPKGSDAGHNGLKNIAQLLNTQEYSRLRFGIGSDFPRGGQIDYVLGKFPPEELQLMPEILDRATEIIKSFCLAGIQITMNQFNNK